MWDGLLYFNTRCPFGVRSSALVCQQTTQAVIHVFTKEGYTANVYLDDFYGAEHPADSHFAFAVSELHQESHQEFNELVECYNTTLTHVLDKHAPLQRKILHQRQHVPW